VKSYIANLQTLSQSTIFSLNPSVKRIMIGALAWLLISSSALTAQTPSAGFLPSPIQVVSTVPSNGDGNPYGVAFCTEGISRRRPDPGRCAGLELQ
jgi:hypothetical protein